MSNFKAIKDAFDNVCAKHTPILSKLPKVEGVDFDWFEDDTRLDDYDIIEDELYHEEFTGDGPKFKLVAPEENLETLKNALKPWVPVNCDIIDI